MSRAADSTSTEDLRVQLEAAHRQLAALSAELDETNKGVVALYGELDAQSEQLRQASELKSRFLSYVSHEFRTPLGSIRSVARILLDRLDGPLTPEQEKQVGFIQTAAVDLNEMVDDLLDLAKVEAGRITISPGWFELVDLFAALRGMFKPILTNNRVSLVFEEPTAVARAYADDKKLSQILRNLISNALKFTLDGEVRISVRPADAGFVTFLVADTGIGISPDQLGRLFHEFSQVDSPLQKHVRGTGLGLALSKRLALVMGGDIRVDSELGRGSMFALTIPAIPIETPPDTQSAAPASSTEGARR